MEYALLSDIGNRAINEDLIKPFITQNITGFILCDGLGGHGMGNIASEIAANELEKCFNNVNTVDVSIIKDCIYKVNSIILKKQIDINAKSKLRTTLTALIIYEKRAYLCHVGDSRIYAFRNNKILFRTHDHSVPEMLALSGKIAEQDIRHHPDRNKVLKVFGMDEENFRCSIEVLDNQNIQAFLLCSDGFWELIDEEKMENLLASAKSVDTWLENMKLAVVQNGVQTNMDNYSAIAIWN